MPEESMMTTTFGDIIGIYFLPRCLLSFPILPTFLIEMYFGMKNLFIALMISKHAWSKQSDKVPNVVFQQLIVAVFHPITWRICGNNLGVWL